MIAINLGKNDHNHKSRALKTKILDTWNIMKNTKKLAF